MLAMSQDIRFYTNINDEGYTRLFQLFTELDDVYVGSYLMDAKMGYAFKSWNMNFIV